MQHYDRIHHRRLTHVLHGRLITIDVNKLNYKAV